MMALRKQTAAVMLLFVCLAVSAASHASAADATADALAAASAPGGAIALNRRLLAKPEPNIDYPRLPPNLKDNPVHDVNPGSLQTFVKPLQHTELVHGGPSAKDPNYEPSPFRPKGIDTDHPVHYSAPGSLNTQVMANLKVVLNNKPHN